VAHTIANPSSLSPPLEAPPPGAAPRRAAGPQGGARERNEREVERGERKERSLGWDRRKRGVRGKYGNADSVEID